MNAALYIRKVLLVTAPAVAILALAGQAHTQESQVIGSAPAALEEIVVTAQKRSENLQSVPISINAASGEEIAARGIAGTMELNILSPGLNINETAGAFQPSIRGIGTSSSVAENPVALYVDGVYLPQQKDGLRGFDDVEQIAVLKGPQGTLFGRNATAGVIQVTTREPSFDFSGKLRAEVDNYETVRVGGYVTRGVSDSVAMSLSANYSKQGEGWGENRTTGRDTYKIDHDFTIRGKLLFQPSDSTDITISGDYTDWRKEMAYVIPLPGTQLASFVSPNPYVTNPLDSLYDSYSGVDNFVSLEGGGASLTINHTRNAVRLVSITAYRDVNSEFQSDGLPVGPVVVVPSSSDAPSRSFSQEFQVLSNINGPVNWMFGLYYFNYDNGVSPLVREFDGLLSVLTGLDRRLTHAIENTESIAPFGELTWEFLPDTRLTGGVRYTYERRELKNAREEFVAVSGGTTTTILPDEAISANEPTFRIGLDHRFSSDFMAYGTFNTGFKSGGFNTVSPATPSFKPEKLKAYEVGLKSELLDRRLRLNVAGFYYDYTNLQVSQFVNQVQTVTNGPKAEIYGVDVDLKAQLFEDLQLSGGFELKRSKFTSYPNAVFGVLGPGGVGASLVPGDATGNRLPQAQNFSGILAVDYHHDLAAGSLDFNITANYSGDFYFQADNVIRQSPYTIVNASATWNLPGDRVSLKVWGKNLTDEIYITTALETPFGFLSGYNMQPRTVGGTVAFNF